MWHNLPSGGGKRALHDHVRGLVARGHTVEAWCPPTADREFLPLGPLVREHVVDLVWPTPLRSSDDWQVTFEPMVRVSDETLLDVLNRAPVMIYAPRLEPFGLAPLEANACGVPVVAVAEGGVRETVVDGVTGLLVAHNPVAIAEAVSHLLADPPLARRLGANARQMVQSKWGLAAATDRIEQHLTRYARAA